MSAKVQAFITNRVAELIDTASTLKWERPWRVPGQPQNFVTRRPYRGVNALVCHLLMTARSFTSPYFLSLKQVLAAGGRVSKMEFSSWSPIVYWKPLEWVAKNSKGIVEKKSCLLPCRFTKVWNLQQTNLPAPPLIRVADVEPLAAVEKIIASMPHPVEIRRGGDKAFYSSAKDFIQLPHDHHWTSSLGRAMTTIHELSHCTGAAHRCNRRTITQPGDFADPIYSEEEIIAELCTAFVMASLGLEQPTIRSSAAYCKSWITALKSDSRAIFRASGQAQKAADYLLGERPQQHLDEASDDAAPAEVPNTA